MLADFVVALAEEVRGVDAGDFHRILEGEEHPGVRPFFRREFEQVLAAVRNRPFGDVVALPSGQDLREGAFARAVGPHDGVDFAGFYFQVDAAQDGGVFNGDVKVFDMEHDVLSVRVVWYGFV